MALTPEQIKERAPRIGGSDAAAICGRDPYKDAFQVAMRMKGDLGADPSLDDADQILFGNEMEGVLARIYQHKHKVELVTPVALVHPKEKQIAVNIDRRIKDNPKVGIECKNTGLHVVSSDPLQRWGAPGTDQVPQRVAIQCLHGMMIDPVIEVFHVLRCYGGNQYQEFILQRDKDAIDALWEIETAFLKNLRAGMIPEPDWYMGSTEGAMKRLYAKIEGTIEARPDLVSWTATWVEASASRLEAEKLEDAIKNRILKMMANTGVAMLPDGGKWVRKKVSKKEYTVKASEYIECRYTKPPKKDKDEEKE